MRLMSMVMLSACCLLSATTVYAIDQRAMSLGTAWYGDAFIRVDDSTFTGESRWTAIGTSEPPLSVGRACQIAGAYIGKEKRDGLTYVVEKVVLHPYFDDTSHWFYVVHFKAVVRPGDDSWRQEKPYAELIASGDNPRIRPALGVGVLMSGKVIAARPLHTGAEQAPERDL